MLKPRCAKKPVTAWTMPFRFGHDKVRMKLDVDDEDASLISSDTMLNAAGGAVFVVDIASRSANDRKCLFCVRSERDTGDRLLCVYVGIETLLMLRIVRTLCTIALIVVMERAHKAINQESGVVSQCQ